MDVRLYLSMLIHFFKMKKKKKKIVMKDYGEILK